MVKDPVKELLRKIPYGIYGLTSRSENEINAMVLTWLTQISFDPRLIAVGLQKTAFTSRVIDKGRVFVVNIFNRNDIDGVKAFTKSRAKNPDKMQDVNYSDAPLTGCPVIEGAAAYIECKVSGLYRGRR